MTKITNKADKCNKNSRNKSLENTQNYWEAAISVGLDILSLYHLNS